MLGQLPSNPLEPHRYHAAKGPLKPDELVPDDILRQLAQSNADRQCGTFSIEDQSILSMILENAFGELLAYRAADRLAGKS